MPVLISCICTIVIDVMFTLETKITSCFGMIGKKICDVMLENLRQVEFRLICHLTL
jgi:hypothetical protein